MDLTNRSLYSLEEIADAWEKKDLVIPPIQRGIVWNATRVELLWDSIMRQIPIGAISVRHDEKSGKYEIYDGQQRTHAIQMGIKNGINDPELLWLDVCPKKEKQQQDDDQKALTRQYWFRVSSKAHPWGYEISKDKETEILSVGEIREYVDNFKYPLTNWSFASRPTPKEMWPKGMVLPVLFADLYTFVRNTRNSPGDPPIESFVDWLTENYRDGEPNWVRHFKDRYKTKSSQWDKIVKAVRRLDQYQVQFMDASNVDPENLGVYFERMNRAGVPPSEEDMQYSLLKLKWDISDLKKMEKTLCKDYGYIPPAKWARLAMSLFWSRTHKDVKIKDQHVIQMSRNNKFKEYILGEKDDPGSFLSVLSRVDGLLGINMSNGLLPWHRTRILQRADALALFVLKSADSSKLPPHLFPGLVMLLKLYGENIQQAVECLLGANDIHEGISKAIKDGALRIPVSPEEMNTIIDTKEVFDRKDWEKRFWRKYQNLATRLDDIAEGFNSARGVDLLIYACRGYIKETFGDYDTGALEWQEQNCPWDYDHILPKAWIGQRSKNRTRFYDVCTLMRDSIGNSAPVPFSLNRSKNCQPPGKDYPDGKKGLHINVDEVAKYDKGDVFVADTNETRIKPFIKTTAERLCQLYSSTYEDLKWKEILRLGSVKDNRKRRISKLCGQLGQLGARVFAVLEDEGSVLIDDPQSLFWFSPQLYVALKGKDKDEVRIVYKTGDDKDGKDGKDGCICICPPAGQGKIKRITDVLLKKLKDVDKYDEEYDDENVYLQKSVENKEVAEVMRRLRLELKRLKSSGKSLLT